MNIRQFADTSLAPLLALHQTGQDRLIGLALRIMRGMTTGIVCSLEARDEYSERHSERVAEMSRRFSVLLGHRAVVTEQIYLAASAHDIGKIGIPDAVLLKEGRLSDEEWAVMKQHPVVGAGILARTKDSMLQYFSDDGIFFPIPSALGDTMVSLREGVLHHHERWDGKGYPDALQGTDIPFLSRLIALCDSTDAMLSRRCYRAPLTKSVCRSELEKNAGIMYDPDLCAVFLEHFDEITDGLYEA